MKLNDHIYPLFYSKTYSRFSHHELPVLNIEWVENWPQHMHDLYLVYTSNLVGTAPLHRFSWKLIVITFSSLMLDTFTAQQPYCQCVWLFYVSSSCKHSNIRPSFFNFSWSLTLLQLKFHKNLMHVIRASRELVRLNTAPITSKHSNLYKDQLQQR